MDKRERFKKVAEQRTNKVLKMIELLGNCANTNNYEYTGEEVKKIFNAIDTQLNETKAKFKNTKEKGSKFKL